MEQNLFRKNLAPCSKISLQCLFLVLTVNIIIIFFLGGEEGEANIFIHDQSDLLRGC